MEMEMEVKLEIRKSGYENMEVDMDIGKSGS